MCVPVNPELERAAGTEGSRGLAGQLASRDTDRGNHPNVNLWPPQAHAWAVLVGKREGTSESGRGTREGKGGKYDQDVSRTRVYENVIVS